MHAALWRSRIYFRFFSKYPLTFSKIFVVFLSKNISWTKILNVRSISPINTCIIESVNELRLNPWDQIVAALPRVLRQFSARGLIQFLNHFHCIKTSPPHNLGARLELWILNWIVAAIDQNSLIFPSCSELSWDLRPQNIVAHGWVGFYGCELIGGARRPAFV